MGTAGIVEIEDDLAREADHRLAHVLHLKTLRGLDDDLVGCQGDDGAVVHHRSDRIVHLERDLGVRTRREVPAHEDDLPSDEHLADFRPLRMDVLDDAARRRDLADRLANDLDRVPLAPLAEPSCLLKVDRGMQWGLSPPNSLTGLTGLTGFSSI